LYDNLQACQPDPYLPVEDAVKAGILIRDGSNGSTMVNTHMPVIRRMQIRRTKQNWAKGINISYGKKLVDIEELPDGVVAKFEDGTSETGTVIVGCDGGASIVRKWLVGEELAQQEILPFAFMNFPFSLPADKAIWVDKNMNPNVDVASLPSHPMYLGIFLLDKPDLDKPESWVFYMLSTWPISSKEDEENTENRLERLRNHMDGWGDPFKSIVAWLPDDVEIKKDQLRVWHPKPWNNRGRVTLAGDAGHR
jgi:2-polyprenyl-6-methoxyphenol hydroxylase-like FAD-dependent oxidoreductase